MRSRTSTVPSTTCVRVPSQRSCVNQKVPRMLADAKRPVVLNTPFAEPQSWRTGFWFLAATEREPEQTEKSPPTSVNSVRPPPAACCTRKLDDTSSAARLMPSAGAMRWLVRRATTKRTFAQLPGTPFESVKVMIPLATSTTSPALRTNCWSPGLAAPLTLIEPVPTALNVPGAPDAGGAGGTAFSSSTGVVAVAVLFDALV